MELPDDLALPLERDAASRAWPGARPALERWLPEALAGRLRFHAAAA